MKAFLVVSFLAVWVTKATADTATFISTQDAYVQGGVEISRGHHTDLIVKEKKSTATRLSLIRRSFLQFDISSLPAGSEIVSATLKLTLKGGQSGAIVSIFDSETFDEDAVVWSDYPEYDQSSQALAQAPFPTNGETFMEWDLSAFIEGKFHAGVTTLAFALDGSQAVGRYVTFRSKEYHEGSRPILTVEYSTEASYEPLALVSVEDTYAKASKRGTNYGTSDRLDVKKNDDRNAFLKFDIKDVPGNAPQITLRLWAHTERQADTSLYEVSSDWQESTLTWDNKPKVGSLIETKPYPAQYQSVTFDVKAYVNAAIAAGANYVSFAMLAETDDSLVKFYSKERFDQTLWPSLEFGEVSQPVYIPPYSLPKFQTVLSGCRLQWPESSPAKVSNGEFEGYAADAFQLVDESFMQFKMAGQGNRCEVRQNEDWATSDPVERRMFARVKLPPPGEDATQITFLQVHNKDFLTFEKGPLLRINWRNETYGYTDHIWASLRVSLDPKDVDKFPLIPRPDGFLDIELKFSNSVMTILINGGIPPLSPEFAAFDLSHWDPMVTNHFKAGVYLNGGGATAIALFDQLEMY